MNRRDDAALVYGFLRKLKNGSHSTAGQFTEESQRAFYAAERLHQSKLQGDTEPAGPIVLSLQWDDAAVSSIRKLAVTKAWFEVPCGSYERLRMIDPATGNKFIVYEGKRGFKAVANVGHPAAQDLLREWKKTRKAS